MRVDPATKVVKLFPLPANSPDANLNTATFDRKGILWFTGQNGVYGRVDPATGKVEAWKAPKGPGPYGITTTPNGEIWYASLAGDYIVKIDTVSGDATDGGAAEARRRSAPHLVGFQRPVMGELLEHWRDWALRSAQQDLESVEPAENQSGCYAIYVDDKDKVWVSDWDANAMQRFDPVMEKFESFPATNGAPTCVNWPDGGAKSGGRIRHRPAGGGGMSDARQPPGAMSCRCFAGGAAWAAGIRPGLPAKSASSD